MAGDRRVEEGLARIRSLEAGEPLGEDQVRLLREAIGGGNGLLIAAGARVARKRALADLVPDLVRALGDLLGRPSKADKGCLAKVAVVEALNALDCPEPEPLLRGVRYRQWEPAYGRTVDTAGLVRAECAIGLARIAHPQAAREIVPLLVDPEPQARAGAVRALAYLGGDPADLLLRMKALSGDEHPAITGECLSALMKIDPTGVVDFVAGFLESKDLTIVEEAAMALASWPGFRSATILRGARKSRMDAAFRERLLVPIAMTRCEEALEALEQVILDEPQEAAESAVKAAAMHRHDPHWKERIGQAVTGREDGGVLRVFEREFEG